MFYRIVPFSGGINFLNSLKPPVTEMPGLLAGNFLIIDYG